MMSSLIFSLLVASVVSTLIWMLQNCLKPLTHKVFSQAWHYYTGLIPIFLLLGGSELFIRLLRWFISVSFYQTSSYEPQIKLQQSVQGGLLAEAKENYTYLKNVFSSLLQAQQLSVILLIATIIWASGAIVYLLLNVLKYRMFKRSLLRESWESKMGNYPVKVMISPKATTPMLVGIWRPVVILPNTQLGEKELSMIMSHELTHLQRGDLIVKLLLLIANTIYWFNPIVYILNRQLNVLCELSCDEKVVRKMDMDNRRLYGKTLLSMLEYSVSQRNVVFTSSFCSPKSEMKWRLLNVMNNKKMKTKVIILSLFSALVLVISGGTAAYTVYAAGTSISSHINIPTGKGTDGRNIYIQSEDGTVLHYDRYGKVTDVTNEWVEKTKQRKKQLDEKTQKKVDEFQRTIQSYLNKGVPVPQSILDELGTEEVLAALEQISGYVYDKDGLRPYNFNR
ncbi:beta-lactamase regulating signal transducer with metallopeptidase domain [Paenibacillus turicensis]|uniref:Beta-lactamase regulating signal transducer with metallopeptidase domain n=2 Tax=Paenibacillus turicensis TaxID=160487 RepID=A0ABS4FWL3_9BACL|nr:beta-lactamase regulating signal transducer with metallopeptidase domain [Paenibacillus turicensis]